MQWTITVLGNKGTHHANTGSPPCIPLTVLPHVHIQVVNQGDACVGSRPRHAFPCITTSNKEIVAQEVESGKGKGRHEVKDSEDIWYDSIIFRLGFTFQWNGFTVINRGLAYRRLAYRRLAYHHSLIFTE